MEDIEETIARLYRDNGRIPLQAQRWANAESKKLINDLYSDMIHTVKSHIPEKITEIDNNPSVELQWHHLENLDNQYVKVGRNIWRAIFNAVQYASPRATQLVTMLARYGIPIIQYSTPLPTFYSITMHNLAALIANVKDTIHAKPSPGWQPYRARMTGRPYIINTTMGDAYPLSLIQRMTNKDEICRFINDNFGNFIANIYEDYGQDIPPENYSATRGPWTKRSTGQHPNPPARFEHKAGKYGTRPRTAAYLGPTRYEEYRNGQLSLERAQDRYEALLAEKAKQPKPRTLTEAMHAQLQPGRNRAESFRVIPATDDSARFRELQRPTANEAARLLRQSAITTGDPQDNALTSTIQDNTRLHREIDMLNKGPHLRSDQQDVPDEQYLEIMKNMDRINSMADTIPNLREHMSQLMTALQDVSRNAPTQHQNEAPLAEMRQLVDHALERNETTLTEAINRLHSQPPTSAEEREGLLVQQQGLNNMYKDLAQLTHRLAVMNPQQSHNTLWETITPWLDNFSDLMGQHMLGTRTVVEITEEANQMAHEAKEMITATHADVQTAMQTTTELQQSVNQQLGSIERSIQAAHTGTQNQLNDMSTGLQNIIGGVGHTIDAVATMDTQARHWNASLQRQLDGQQQQFKTTIETGFTDAFKGLFDYMKSLDERMESLITHLQQQRTEQPQQPEIDITKLAEAIAAIQHRDNSLPENIRSMLNDTTRRINTYTESLLTTGQQTGHHHIPDTWTTFISQANVKIHNEQYRYNIQVMATELLEVFTTGAQLVTRSRTQDESDEYTEWNNLLNQFPDIQFQLNMAIVRFTNNQVKPIQLPENLDELYKEIITNSMTTPQKPVQDYWLRQHTLVNNDLYYTLLVIYTIWAKAGTMEGPPTALGLLINSIEAASKLYNSIEVILSAMVQPNTDAPNSFYLQEIFLHEFNVVNKNEAQRLANIISEGTGNAPFNPIIPAILRAPGNPSHHTGLNEMATQAMLSGTLRPPPVSPSGF